MAVANKDQECVQAGLEAARRRLIFPLQGIDSDNGTEFINDHLLRYCRRARLTFTRCRPYHKDDQAHVDQKNWKVARQLIGYSRFEGTEACAQLNRIYELLHIYVNGYLPIMKLVGKERDGAKMNKRYDQAMTPYRRALEVGVVMPEQQVAFKAAVTKQGLLTLPRAIERELNRLWGLRWTAKSPWRRRLSVYGGDQVHFMRQRYSQSKIP